MPQLPQEPRSDIILYTAPDGHIRVEVLLEDETFWLSQKRMAELFGVEVNTINYHLKSVFESGELSEESVIRKFRITAADGKAYLTNLYNLDAIISVGYRVNSHQATRFRQWATQTLREFILKGFVLDDDRLKQGERFGKDYFKELLERIREIRASERRFYQKITDIYATSIDYDKDAEITRQFFKVVQNKLEWAITGQTAAEIVHSRANANAPNMGLKTWKDGPAGKIRKTDVAVAKNYLTDDELRQLNRIVTMYLDFAETQAERNIPMKMADWVSRLDAFLELNGYEILENAGKISQKVAKQLAESEFERFRVVQDKAYESDFDRAVKGLQNPKQPPKP